MTLTPGSVWVDAQGAQSADYAERGIGRYIGEQLGAVNAAAPRVIGNVHLDPDVPIPATLEALVGTEILRWGPNRPEPGSPRPSIYHVASPMELTTSLDDLWPTWARSPAVRTVVTLYDFIPMLFRQWYLDPWPVNKAVYFARLGLLRRADHALAISEQTAEDAVEHLGIPESRVTVIDCGVSQKFSSLVGSRIDAAELLRETVPRLRGGFLLYVGGDDPRKNLDGALRGYSLLPGEVRHAHQLVIVCKMQQHRVEEFSQRAQELGIDRDDLLFTGFVTDSQLAALYRSCELFVFPSLYEGAGLPILEAMSCGAPVIGSGVSSIPEILGDRRGTFDPANPADIARCIVDVVDDAAELDALRERSRDRVAIYTWERVADKTLAGYERALDIPRPRPRSRRRKRVAMVTPWPPQWTGVARHSRRVVEHLRSHADVDVIVNGNGDRDAYDRSLEPEGVGLFMATDFDWLRSLCAYDGLLYVLGGSPFHVDAFEALMRTPGAVVVHDVRLLHLYAAVQDERRPLHPGWMLDKLRQMYGHRVSMWDLRHVGSPDVYVKQDVFMTREIQERAEKIIVHSHYQEDILRLECPSAAARTYVSPLGVPEAPLRTQRVERSDPPVIVTLGLVSASAKRMPLLLAGFAGLRTVLPAARLQVVGELPDRERETLGELIGELELGGSVELLGRVERERYWEILGSADLAVQLRASLNAGPSAAVLDCVAARVPVIATNIGSLRELPEKVIVPVPDECSAEKLAARMELALEDRDLRARLREAQERYAREASFANVAERYAEVLAL
jgi:glycosyltransferase involved in cell wall biosynthesis